jgi:GNAT superfamily N-acetyltransferase
LLSTSENKIAGFSWAFADPGKKMLGLAVSGVAKPYRGKGLAARLLISRLEWGLSNGLTYARTHVGSSGRINGWHWRLLSLGGSIDTLLLQSPLPEIGIRPEEQSAADQAIRAAQSKPYPQSRKPVESVLKKHPTRMLS